MVTMNKLLLCCDLDRTVLPNGHPPEDRLARPLFARITARPEITLVYVSGRDRRLLLDAIGEYGIPVPDFAIGDVGTTLYRIQAGEWEEDVAWSGHISEDWQGRGAGTLRRYLEDIAALRLQEPEKQNRHKLSYYADTDLDVEALLADIRERFEAKQIRANLTWSVDEMKDLGLLDVLPARASKRHAIEFLLEHYGFRQKDAVFAGDSGNDLPVLTCGIPAVLVHNAQENVRREAVAQAREQGGEQALYLARGDFLGLNGNYTAGVLEGLAHFQPHTRKWMETELRELEQGEI